jgi:hypothetical protein
MKESKPPPHVDGCVDGVAVNILQPLKRSLCITVNGAVNSAWNCIEPLARIRCIAVNSASDSAVNSHRLGR